MTAVVSVCLVLVAGSAASPASADQAYLEHLIAASDLIVVAEAVECWEDLDRAAHHDRVSVKAYIAEPLMGEPESNWLTMDILPGTSGSPRSIAMGPRYLLFLSADDDGGYRLAPGGSSIYTFREDMPETGHTVLVQDASREGYREAPLAGILDGAWIHPKVVLSPPSIEGDVCGPDSVAPDYSHPACTDRQATPGGDIIWCGFEHGADSPRLVPADEVIDQLRTLIMEFSTARPDLTGNQPRI